jgi:hypothetical protein
MTIIKIIFRKNHDNLCIQCNDERPNTNRCGQHQLLPLNNNCASPGLTIRQSLTIMSTPTTIDHVMRQLLAFLNMSWQ